MLHVAPAGNSYKAEEITEHRSPDPRRGSAPSALAVRRHRRGRHGRHPQRQDRLPARPAPGRPVPRGLRSALARRPLCRRRTRAGAGVHQRREDLQRRLVQPRRQERLVLRFRRHQPARRLPSHRPEVQPHQLDLRHAHAPIHKTWTGHKGVDYAAPSGTPIHSTADGTVEFSAAERYGNVVIVKHHGKYSTLYAHQSPSPKASPRAQDLPGHRLGHGPARTAIPRGQPAHRPAVGGPARARMEPAEIRAFKQPWRRTSRSSC